MKKIIELASCQKEQSIIRLAAYTRVSSNSDDQLHSFAAQIRYYTDYAAKHPGFELVDIYADEAVTGTCMDKRDDFNRLIRDCKKGRIDRIITKSVSRFARNTEELLTIVRMLKEIGISVYFEEQGIDTEKLSTEMILTLPAMVAQKESENISANLRWSYRKRMESGEFNSCRAAYGYSLIDGNLEINEAESQVIRRVFSLYLSGMGKQAIANLFNSEKTPKRYGQDKWHTFTIDYILKNERYMGDALLQKCYTTDALPYRKKFNKGEKPKYYIENSNPPIISRDIFMAAQAFQQQKKTRHTTKQSYTLTGLIKCPDCGHTYRRKMVGKTPYWICSYKAAGRTNCTTRAVSENSVYEAFSVMVYKLSKHRQCILGNLIEQLETIQNQAGGNREKTLKIDRKIADFNAKNHVLAQLRTQGILNDAEYTAETLKLDQEIALLRSERRKAIVEDEDEELIDTLKALNAYLTKYEPSDQFDEELFAQIIDGITVIRHTELQFELMGGLRLTENIIEKVRRRT